MADKQREYEKAKKLLELATRHYNKKETYTLKEVFDQIKDKLNDNQQPAGALETMVTTMTAFAKLRLANIGVESADYGGYETWCSHPCLRKKDGRYKWDIISNIVYE